MTRKPEPLTNRNLTERTNMTKQTRKHRSPAELIAEREAQLEKLKTRAALDQAKTSPEVACVIEALEKVNVQMRESSKLLGDSPQGCRQRRLKHELWIAEIDAAQYLAEQSQASQKRAKDALQALLTDAISALTADETLDVDELAIAASQVLADLETSTAIDAAKVAYDNARIFRQNHGAEVNENESEAAAS